MTASLRPLTPEDNPHLSATFGSRIPLPYPRIERPEGTGSALPRSFGSLSRPSAYTTSSIERMMIERELVALCTSAESEVFEEGSKSQFSRNLTAFVYKYGNEAIDLLSANLEMIDEEVAAEALRWIGYMKHSPTRQNRFRLLIESLASASEWIRDGAVIGLELAGDPAAILSLRSAIECEQESWIRRRMEQVLQQLERKLHAIFSEKNQHAEVMG